MFFLSVSYKLIYLFFKLTFGLIFSEMQSNNVPYVTHLVPTPLIKPSRCMAHMHIVNFIQHILMSLGAQYQNVSSTNIMTIALNGARLLHNFYTFVAQFSHFLLTQNTINFLRFQLMQFFNTFT
uniref:Putative secreted protein n=1 Tax=Nyssomyia neivai TaxID=330878 RepID=A0A1L8DNF5_9DIPT